jgi:hypothetical protein
MPRGRFQAPAAACRPRAILLRQDRSGGRILIDIGRRTALALVPPGGNWLHIAALQNDHNIESQSRFQEAFIETHE